MANSALIDKEWELPEGLYKHLNRIKSAYKGEKNAEGYFRLTNLLEDPKIKYGQLKRIKNFFDKYEGDKNSTEFILNGGLKMKHWVNDVLDRSRRDIKNPKKIKKDTGMSNQFIDTHDKNTISTDSIKIKNNKITSSSRHIYDNRGIQEIKELDSLIKIIENNKRLWQTDK
jgi:hypothetical protein